ncbi:hypothetical protein HHK36_026301 [Tetracentron sinense]|uniref:Uncharacterized protein n=1 Tax=Tetracentron sinense TaxID=13715 RepID=A0A835D4G9_TETSI|nr:hypothetical protein HHK36_026301 [Tetracentron sinense]
MLCQLVVETSSPKLLCSVYLQYILPQISECLLLVRRAAMEVVDEGVERVVESKDLRQQSKALDKLTDHVEDHQLSSTRILEAMASFAASAEADWNA